MTTVRLSLVSHTNVGKTTLARTLLKREIGEVRDAAHVTEHAEGHALIETADGDVLELWDTPGFGDSLRLLRRLRQDGNPLGWFLAQVWDRYTDRPFFSSQQAVRNVRDTADAVLYLVNATEDAAGSAYVDAEMEILGWTGRPVLVLLNQLGPPRAPELEAAEVERWSTRLSACACVRGVLAFDAFARCWVQEHELLERVGAMLPPEARAGYGRIVAAWDARNAEVFHRSMDVLAAALAGLATDRVEVATRTLGETARAWIAGAVTGAASRGDPGIEAAEAGLASRHDAALRRSMEAFIALHGLSGSATGEILRRMESACAVEPAADAGRAGVIGAALSGALGGLAADLATGGLSFGAGALIGGLLGVAGGHGLARAWNHASGRDATTVRWSREFMDAAVSSAVLRYLAVAHFGRGRGDFVQGESPAHWPAIVDAAVAGRRSDWAAAWERAGQGAPAAELEPSIAAAMAATVDEVLRTLYPQHRRAG